MDIHPLTNTDLKSVAQVHMLAFPDAALTKLGTEAIRRYYLWQLDGPHDSIGIGAFADTQLAGFCFAGVFQNAETGFLLKNRSYLLWRFMTHPWFLNNEMVRSRVNSYLQEIRIFTKRKRNPVELPTAPSIEKFGILSIAVHPDYQRLGVGNLLMQKIEEFARAKGFSSMRLSVHPNNLKAVLFYEKLGWRKVSAPEDEWLGFMTKDLHDNEESIVFAKQ
jgi:ribosomal protein S18 acetylase RimI-like enzyme